MTTTPVRNDQRAMSYRRYTGKGEPMGPATIEIYDRFDDPEGNGTAIHDWLYSFDDREWPEAKSVRVVFVDGTYLEYTRYEATICGDHPGEQMRRDRAGIARCASCG